jgi:phosphoserine phosphatase RsbU/P
VWPEGSSEHIRRLQSVTDAALAHLRLDELLAALLERTREILEVDTCAILLLDEETNELVARAALGIEEGSSKGYASRSAQASQVASPPRSGL